VTPSGPEDSPGFLLWRLTLRWQREVAAALRPLELTHVQFVLLAGAWWLERVGPPPSQRELAAHADTDAMMTSQVVRALESRQLLVRTADAADARVRRLAVTPAGQALVQNAIGVVEAVDERFFAPASDRPRLIGDLARLVDRGST